MYTRLPVWAPSPVADPLFREVPKAIDAAEIAEVVAGYARSPNTVPREASTASNCSARTRRSCAASSRRRRTSAPTATAARSPTGHASSSRSSPRCDGVIGSRLAVGVRLCGDELIEGGTTIDEAVEVARLVEASGHVDYINTSIGVATASLFMIEASMHIPPGLRDVHPDRRSARRSSCRSSASDGSRIRCRPSGPSPRVTAIWSAIVRGQIADADFAAKAKAGATDEIRLCLSCNQECVGRMGLNRWLGCIENPRDRARGAQASRWRRRADRPPARRDGGRRRAGGSAGGDRRGAQRPSRHGVREGAARRRAGPPGGIGARTAPSSAT